MLTPLEKAHTSGTAPRGAGASDPAGAVTRAVEVPKATLILAQANIQNTLTRHTFSFASNSRAKE